MLWADFVSRILFILLICSILFTLVSILSPEVSSFSIMFSSSKLFESMLNGSEKIFFSPKTVYAISIEYFVFSVRKVESGIPASKEIEFLVPLEFLLSTKNFELRFGFPSAKRPASASVFVTSVFRILAFLVPAEVWFNFILMKTASPGQAFSLYAMERL